MLKDIEVTLYDIFGFLLPGFVSLAGLALAFSVPTESFISVTDRLNWWAVAIIAYLIGHLIQAIANVVTRWFPSAEERVLGDKGDLPAIVVQAAKSTVSEKFAIPVGIVDNDLLYHFCDEVIAQTGNKSDRDIYIYREGFYRGLMISFVLLALGILIRISILGAAYRFIDNTMHVTSAMYVSGLVISLVGIMLCYMRYQRFGKYRVRQAVVGFLVIQKKLDAQPTSKTGK